METLGKITACGLMLIVSTIIGGFILMKLWSWFLSPTLNIQELTVMQAIGLNVLFVWLKGTSKESKDKSMSTIFLESLIYSIVFFGFAWIVSLFM